MDKSVATELFLHIFGTYIQKRKNIFINMLHALCEEPDSVILVLFMY